MDFFERVQLLQRRIDTELMIFLVKDARDFQRRLDEVSQLMNRNWELRVNQGRFQQLFDSEMADRLGGIGVDLLRRRKQLEEKRALRRQSPAEKRASVISRSTASFKKGFRLQL